MASGEGSAYGRESTGPEKQESLDWAHGSLSVGVAPHEPRGCGHICVWAEDEVFCQHAGWTSRSAEAVRDFWLRQVETPPADLIRRAATSADEGLLGYVDLHGAKPRERELGFLTGPSLRWGRGLGGRVAKAGLVYGFEELSLGSIWAEALIANAASVRILRSVGMRETGRGSAETFSQEESCYLQFRISRDEWSLSGWGR